MKIESPVFNHNTFIPKEYTCNGANHSPPLVWNNAPKNTKSFVLIMDDPDAPMGTWVHWVLFNIPSDYHELQVASSTPSQAISATNSWGSTGYGGPCPPSGSTHRYCFKLYALDTVLSLDKKATKKDVERAMQNHILDHAELIGKYSQAVH